MDRKYKLPRLKYKGDPEANAQWVRDASKRAGVEEATRATSGRRGAKATMALGPSAGQVCPGSADPFLNAKVAVSAFGVRRAPAAANAAAEPAAPADKYRLRKPAPAPAASAPGSALEKPPPGASAHELACARRAGVAARGDNSGEGEGGAFAEDSSTRPTS
ncbi:hypothetical protein JL720_7466 [Aureococcus anophagefferens]|nr:hypothetical protein JL720_7466 [Aureococcus anophagefferens]